MLPEQLQALINQVSLAVNANGIATRTAINESTNTAFDYSEALIDSLRVELTQVPDYQAMLAKVQEIDAALDGDAESGLGIWNNTIARVLALETNLAAANTKNDEQDALIAQTVTDLSDLNTSVTDALAQLRTDNAAELAAARSAIMALVDANTASITLTTEALDAHKVEQAGINLGVSTDIAAVGDRVSALESCCESSKSRLTALELETSNLKTISDAQTVALEQEAAARLEYQSTNNATNNAQDARLNELEANSEGSVSSAELTQVFDVLSSSYIAGLNSIAAVTGRPVPTFNIPTQVIDPTPQPVIVSSQTSTAGQYTVNTYDDGTVQTIDIATGNTISSVSTDALTGVSTVTIANPDGTITTRTFTETASSSIDTASPIDAI